MHYKNTIQVETQLSNGRTLAVRANKHSISWMAEVYELPWDVYWHKEYPLHEWDMREAIEVLQSIREERPYENENIKSANHKGYAESLGFSDEEMNMFDEAWKNIQGGNNDSQ